MDEDIDYHRRRALRELDLGLVAGTSAAARAHLELSSLHMRRMLELKGEAARPVHRSAFAF